MIVSIYQLVMRMAHDLQLFGNSSQSNEFSGVLKDGNANDWAPDPLLNLGLPLQECDEVCRYVARGEA